MRASIQGDATCVTAIGMVSSLGCDVFNACAAARAGISRATELNYFRLKSRDDGEVRSLRGHPVPNTTTGFEAWARILVLLKLALEDLLHQSPRKKMDHSRIGLYLALPDLQRVHRGLDRIADEEIKENRAHQGSLPPATQTSLNVERVCRMLTGGCGLKIPMSYWFPQFSGHCGVAIAVIRAIEDLQAGKVECALVGAADSLIEEDTLQWLVDTGRMKMDGVPDGLQPGEAAGFMMLERTDTAVSRGDEILADIVEIQYAEEGETLLSGKPSVGAGLARCLTAALQHKPEQDPLWLLVDQNGETYRANEWGFALTRLLPCFPALRDAILSWPAMAFGDTGAASGVMAICMAISAFQRKYDPSNIALIVSSSDENERTCLRLEKRTGLTGIQNVG